MLRKYHKCLFWRSDDADAMVDKDPVTKRSRTVTKIIPSISGARLFHVSNRRKRRIINTTRIR